MRDPSSVQVFCAEYETLLKKSQVALSNWSTGRAAIHEFHLRGRDTRNELRELQMNFVKAWAGLQHHKQDCEVCQVVTPIEGVRSQTDAGTLHQLYN